MKKSVGKYYKGEKILSYRRVYERCCECGHINRKEIDGYNLKLSPLSIARIIEAEKKEEEKFRKNSFSVSGVSREYIWKRMKETNQVSIGKEEFEKL